MLTTDPEDFYRAYVACLNAQDWLRLPDFVATDVHHNGHRLGVEGYRAMLQNDFAAIPDLRFVIELLIAIPSCIGSRLRFDCSPLGTFLGHSSDAGCLRVRPALAADLSGCRGAAPQLSDQRFIRLICSLELAHAVIDHAQQFVLAAHQSRV